MRDLEILLTASRIEVILCAKKEYYRTLYMEFVLDINQFDVVIGIEILNLKLETGKKCLVKIEKCIGLGKGDVRYSYDEESDAFYLQLSSDCSIKQEAVNGEVYFDQGNVIIGLCANRA